MLFRVYINKVNFASREVWQAVFTMRLGRLLPGKLRCVPHLEEQVEKGPLKQEEAGHQHSKPPLTPLTTCTCAATPASQAPAFHLPLRLESNHTGSATNDLCIPFLRAGWGRWSTLHTSSCNSIRGSGVANHPVLIVALRLFFWKRYMGRLGITMPSLLKQYQQRRPRQ